MRAIGLLLGLLLCQVTLGATPLDQLKGFQIEAQSVASALLEFSKQADIQVITASLELTDLQTRGVTGKLPIKLALTTLLSGTGLGFKVVNETTVAIHALKADSTSASAPQASSDAPAPPAVKLAQSGSQDSTGPAASSNELQEFTPSSQSMPEILVKGSRIMNVDVKRTEDDVQPYTILDAKQIEQSGAADVEDFLKQQLTMNTAIQTNAQAFASIGGTTSAINLRGLGTNETLILIDGRRSAGVSLQGVDNQPDINGIPLAAIERIEVLPSSASAIYGGAAVGGVINIILKKNFEGGELHYTYDRASSSSANQRTVSGSYGFSLAQGRTQIMVGGQYSDGRPLLLQDRLNIVDRGVSDILNNSPSYLYNPSQPFQGATPNIASADGSDLTLKNGTSLQSPITSIPAGTAPGSNLSAALLANAGKYNLKLGPGTDLYGLQSPFGTIPLTKSLFATIRQALFDDVQLFTEFSTNSNAGRTLNSPFAGAFTIPSTAPTNPFQQDVLVTFPSTVEATQTTDSVTQSVTTGVLVPLARGWSSEADYTWSRNAFDYANENYDIRELPAALNDGTLNPFADTLAHPLNLAHYLAPVTYSGASTLNDLGLRASGPVGSLPGGHPTLTVGLEHRKEGTDNANLDQHFPLDPENGFRLTYFGQSQSTDSLYAEGQIPLISRLNEVPAIRSLDLQIAGRAEHYTVQAGTASAYIYPPFLEALNPPQGEHSTIKYTSTNPTIGLKYQPVADIIFRASYSGAFLPPTPSQLLPNPTPVCSSPCAQIIDPKNGQSYLVNFSDGGNPDLQPQTSRDWDLGMIWEPQEEALRGLRMDLEYYKITQPNYITSPSVQQIVSNPKYTSRVTRDPTTGLITTVDAGPLNATEYKTSGWDLKVDYRKETAFGTLGARLAGTVIKYDLREYTIGSPFLEYAGFANEGGEGKIKANAMLSWEYQRWTASWTATYYSNYAQYSAPGSPSAILYGAYTFYTDAQGGYTIPSQTYHDIYASYAFPDGATGHGGGWTDKLLSNVTVQFGVKNVFNKVPPFDSMYYPYFYSPYGDARLRDFRISVKKVF